MAAPDPTPGLAPDGTVDVAERPFTTDVPVIVGPTSYDGVEYLDHLGSSGTSVCFENGTDLGQVAFDRCLGWLDDQFAVVFTDVLTEKVEPLFDVYNTGFLW